MSPAAAGARPDRRALLDVMKQPALRPFLTSWQEAFADTPAAQVRLLGRLLEALAPLIETAEAARRAGREELDSYDDLANAGPLDRLLASELLWLKLSPPEFARRLAEGEALRRRPDYLEPAEDRAVFAMIDCGAAMLGRRRLVALAGLLALAASAERRGAALYWTTTGFGAAPEWTKGITRRGLSRFVRQTSIEGLGGAFVARAWAAAPASRPRGGPEPLLWLIQPMGAGALDIGDAQTMGSAPTDAPFLLEIGERPPRRALQEDRPRAQLTVRRGAASLASAEVAYPAERLCAEALRAPFKAPPPPTEAGAAIWAPQRLTLDPAGRALLYRDGAEIFALAPGGAALRVHLREETELIGLRVGDAGACLALWRRGERLHLGRIDFRDGHLRTVRKTIVAPDSPFASEAHAPHALPPVLRVASDGVLAATPGGRIYKLGFSARDDGDRFEMRPSGHLSDLQLLARVGHDWLCLSDSPQSETPLLVGLRRGARRPLGGAARLLAQGVRGALAVPGDAGVLAETKSGWRWLTRLRGAERAEPPQPALPKGVFCLSAAAGPAYARQPSQKSGRRPPWSLVFWSADGGVQRAEFGGAHWRYAKSARGVTQAALGGRARAMTAALGAVYAARDDGGDASALVSFPFGDQPFEGGVVVETETRRIREAPCVRL